MEAEQDQRNELLKPVITHFWVHQCETLRVDGITRKIVAICSEHLTKFNRNYTQTAVLILYLCLYSFYYQKVLHLAYFFKWNDKETEAKLTNGCFITKFLRDNWRLRTGTALKIKGGRILTTIFSYFFPHTHTRKYYKFRIYSLWAQSKLTER